MSKAITITLAGESFTIRTFTLNQLRAAMAAIPQPEDIDKITGVLAAVLSRDYPEAKIGDLEISGLGELAEAVTAILNRAGLGDPSLVDSARAAPEAA